MKSLKRARRLFPRAGAYYHLLRQESRVRNPPGLLKRIDTLRRGFWSSQARNYDFGKYDPSLFVTDIQMHLARNLNGRHGEVLDNKIVFGRILPSGALTPKIYAYLHAGRLSPLCESWRETSLDDLLIKPNEHGKLVLKPVFGLGGQGIFVIGMQGNSMHLNNDIMNFERARALLSKLTDYIVTEFVQQDEFASSIFPGALNTIRLLTMRDADTDEPFIAAAVHRFASQRSAPTDNVHAGGLGALIDLESGVLGAAAERAQDRFVTHDLHPDTGAQINGRVVPNWSALREHLLEVANRLPFLCYVGWDVAMTAKGPVFIEGNRRPMPRLFQVHRPLLLDPRIKRFYEKRGVV
jgi:hypothetical protein